MGKVDGAVFLHQFVEVVRVGTTRKSRLVRLRGHRLSRVVLGGGHWLVVINQRQVLRLLDTSRLLLGRWGLRSLLLVVVKLFKSLLIESLVSSFLLLHLALLALVQNLQVLQNFVFFLQVLSIFTRFLFFLCLAFGRNLRL